MSQEIKNRNSQEDFASDSLEVTVPAEQVQSLKAQDPTTESINEPLNECTVPRRAAGPQTDFRKERSSRNAIKHGILSKGAFLHGESRSQFNALLDGLREDLQPVGTLEHALVEKIAISFLCSGRVLRKQVEAYSQLEIYGSSQLMELLLRYETNIDRGLERTLNQLERIQRLRLGQAVPPALKIDVSSSLG
jgi:hypothetical protein